MLWKFHPHEAMLQPALFKDVRCYCTAVLRLLLGVRLDVQDVRPIDKVAMYHTQPRIVQAAMSGTQHSCNAIGPRGCWA